MDGKVYDVPEVLAALEAAVAERGEGYVYDPPRYDNMPRCLYTHKAADGTLTPGCLVGQVYFALTGDLVPFTDEDQDGPVGYNRHTRPVFTGPARVVLAAAQKCQDGGGTWGQALANARTTAAD